MELPKEIEKLIEKKALFVCSHSGGKDSQAMYLFLKNIVPPEQLIVIHADLAEVEWEGTYQHIVDTVTEHPIFKVKADKTFFEMVEDRTMWPSTRFRQCTSDLKTAPIFKESFDYMKKHGFSIMVNCVGIRAEESSARAKKIPFQLNEKRTAKTKNRYVYDWCPIFDWSTRDVFRFILDSGEKPHWAYAKGMSRLSCCFCIMANKQDLKTSSEINPELLEEYAKLEKKIGHTVFMSKGKPIGIKDYINEPVARKSKGLVRLGDMSDEYDFEDEEFFECMEDEE